MRWPDWPGVGLWHRGHCFLAVERNTAEQDVVGHAGSLCHEFALCVRAVRG